MKILFASQNKGKQKEAKILFKDLAIDLVFPDEFKEFENFDVDETGKTFAENATLKAKAYAKQINLPCIADDSGVIIDGMNGLPGVHSNRWFNGTSDERNQEVLNRLKNRTNRNARYITVACFYDPNTKKCVIFEGVLEGSIGTKIIGNTGFDYDRIFIPNGFDKTYAQLGENVKNSTSQRAKAFKKVKDYIKKYR
ncbi:MAG: RdgB/HAM1 family non-canonical purine NTP pyrophosphatase [Pseudomonadales bacterium]|nr:RdgB/HAM1 family non-canonical purine NTP pyrophosphatase [Pseudomonadales bacterium]